MEAIVLCAGEGVRLRPLTHHIAKPLVPVANEPLLRIILRNLASAGLFNVGVNAWYRKEDIVSFCAVENFPGKISVIEENEILGTGGGIANIAASLNINDTFLVHNGDIFCDFDLAKGIRFHRERGAMCTLFVKSGATEITAVGEEVVDVAGRLGAKGERAYKFIGVSVWQPECLRFFPGPGTPGNAVDAMVAIILNHPNKIKVFDIGGAVWSDIGAPKAYLELHRSLLGRNVKLARGIILPEGTRIAGFLCVGKGAKIGAGCRFKDVVVWENSEISNGVNLSDAIVGGFGALRI